METRRFTLLEIKKYLKLKNIQSDKFKIIKVGKHIMLQCNQLSRVALQSSEILLIRHMLPIKY